MELIEKLNTKEIKDFNIVEGLLLFYGKIDLLIRLR